MLEPAGDGGVRLGVSGSLGLRAAQALFDRHYAFPVACYPWP
jgi:hypothetical protein